MSDFNPHKNPVHKIEGYFEPGPSRPSKILVNEFEPDKADDGGSLWDRATVENWIATRRVSTDGLLDMAIDDALEGKTGDVRARLEAAHKELKIAIHDGKIVPVDDPDDPKKPRTYKADTVRALWPSPDQAQKSDSSTPGKPERTRYAIDDLELIAKMKTMIEETGLGPWNAAQHFATEAKGAGTDESKARRLYKKYKNGIGSA